MFTHYRSVLGVLALAAFATACSDVSKTPTSVTPTAVSRIPAGLHLGEYPVICTLYRRDEFGLQGREVRTRRVTVYFPRAELSPRGATWTYHYEGYTSGPDLVAYTTCEIPGTDAAVRRMDRLFRIKRAEQDEDLGYTTHSCDEVTSNGTCVIRLTATACLYGGTYPDCNHRLDVDYDSCNVMEYECTGGSAEWYGGGESWGWTDDPDGDGTGREPCQRDDNGHCVTRNLTDEETGKLHTRIESIRTDQPECAAAKQYLTDLYDLTMSERAQGKERQHFRFWDGTDIHYYPNGTRDQRFGENVGDGEGARYIEWDSYWAVRSTRDVVHEGLHYYLWKINSPLLGDANEAWVDDMEEQCI